MKKITLSILIFMCLLIPIGVVAVDETVSPLGVFEVVSEDMVVDVNKSKALVYSLVGFESTPHSISFQMDNQTIAQVSSDGVVKGLQKGKTFVSLIVTFEDETQEPYIKKINVEVVEILPELSFAKSLVNVVRAGTYKVEYSFIAGTSSSDIIWDSSDPSIASVVDGVVKAHRVGTATIRARVSNVEATMTINVIVPLEKLEFNPNKITLQINQDVKLPSLIYVPYDTTASKQATYYIEDKNIAVFENGKLVGVNAGTTTVIAKVGDKTAVLKVVVEDVESLNKSFIVPFRITHKTDDVLTLRSGSLATYRGGKVDVELPVEEMIAYMKDRELTRIRLVFDEVLTKDNFDLVNSIIIPKDLFILLGAQKLEIEVLDSEHIVWSSYLFSTRTKEDVDLKLTANLIGPNSGLVTETGGQKAYTLRFNNSGFPDNTVITLNTKIFNQTTSDYYFLYKNNGGSLTYADQQAQPQEGFVKFVIDESSYVVSFNKFAGSENKVILYALIAVVVTILGALGLSRFKGVRNKD